MPTSYVRLIEVFVDRFDNSRQKLKWARRTWSPTHQENGFFYLFFVRIVHLGNRVYGCFKNERNEKKITHRTWPSVVAEPLILSKGVFLLQRCQYTAVRGNYRSTRVYAYTYIHIGYNTIQYNIYLTRTDPVHVTIRNNQFDAPAESHHYLCMYCIVYPRLLFFFSIFYY